MIHTAQKVRVTAIAARRRRGENFQRGGFNLPQTPHLGVQLTSPKQYTYTHFEI